MKARTNIWALLLLLAAFGSFGCRRNIVRASPASVAPPAEQPESAPEPAAPVAVAEPEPPPAPAPEPVPEVPTAKPVPVRPRPAPAESETKPKAEPEPEAPQISPQLTPQQQTEAIQHTTDDVRTAEKNLQLANGKQLNASQKDLAGKISEFLAQAHEAIRANDWVRAQNLARKAAILSNELLKAL
jgi:hypothetical protein